MPSPKTPIARELERLAAMLAADAKTGRVYAATDLSRAATHLRFLANRTAPIERFHAELVAEAAAEELRLAEMPIRRGAGRSPEPA